MEHETAGNVAEDILSVQEEKQLIYVADLLKAKGIGKECALWTCISAADAGKLEEYIQFVENASLTEAILHEWEQKNIQRPSKLYEYEEGLEYEFVGFEEDWRRTANKREFLSTLLWTGAFFSLFASLYSATVQS